ncbi:MAG: UDP-N-acetylmuramoyl-tripeptide--D-alanyl-D-alanine ligase [Anaerolineae bacterium]|nr:UDP-N-acetylmuramoyl-tripeptide--D-alanyl-D-alanine ligase [Anaerolineae bacterium]
MALTLADVIEGLTGHIIEVPQPVSNIVIDSRMAEASAVFVALPGETLDGHAFVKEAFDKGAMAAITQQPVEACAGRPVITSDTLTVESPLTEAHLPVCIQVEDSLQGLQSLASFWRKKFTPRVIGVTGSVGKSTTKELIAAVLSSRFKTLKNEGNLNNEIGLPLTLLNLNETHERVVLEMGMYALGEIALLCDLSRPQVGVVTNVGPTHLERLGTIERIAAAKTELVQALPPGAEPLDQGGVAILNYDDPLVLPMREKTEATVLTYGLSPDADLWASEVVSMGLEGVRFVFNYQGETIHVKVPLLGLHSVHTALRAALVGLVEGLDWAEIIGGLQTLPTEAQLRLVAVPGPNQSILLDDTYNASPASTLSALNLLDDLTAAKKIAVLGDMLELGSYEEEGHRKVGCRAADVVDSLLVIGELAGLIAAEAQACGLDPARIFQLESNQAAIAHLQTHLGPDDVVLIKGSNAQKLDEIVSALMVKDQSSSPA